MLIIRLRPDERVRILNLGPEDEVEVRIVAVSGGQRVGLGFMAAPHIKISRVTAEGSLAEPEKGKS